MSSSNASKPTLEKPIVDADDDLDDLDDVLDEFNEGPKAPPPTARIAPVPSHTGRPRTNTRVDAQPTSLPGRGLPLDTAEEELDEDVLSAEFAEELAKGMENLMRDIAEQAGTQLPTSGVDGDGSTEGDEQVKAFRAAWEAMLIEEMNGKEGNDPLISLGEVLGEKQPKSGAPSSGGPSSSNTGENFQEKIKQVRGKFKEMEDKAKAAESSGAAGASGLSPESMDDLFKSLKDLGLGDLNADGAGGGESEAELAGFLESMMGQLMSKDILYDPLKELADGFPPYLANPPKPLSDEDKERYGKQFNCVKQIVAIFDQPSYSDSDPEASKKVVDLMSEMQTYGSPPPEIMGPLPPGFDGTFPGLNPNDENCTIA